MYVHEHEVQHRISNRFLRMHTPPISSRKPLMLPAAINMNSSLSDSMWNQLTRVTLQQMLAVVGLLFIVYIVFLSLLSLFKGIYSSFLGHLIGNNVDLTKMGQWAEQRSDLKNDYGDRPILAKMGINIVLISRSEEKLKKVANAISEEFNVLTKIIAADFTGGLEIYDSIKKNLEGLEIGVLINNVGMSYPYPEILTKLPNGDKFVMDLINCNCLSCTMMCLIVLPGMVERKKGVVLNISSGAGILPVPLLSVYGASKIYVDRLSEALAYEYSDTGVVIQSVLPFYVATKLSKIRSSSLFVPTPADYVCTQLKTIGLEKRTFGTISHKIRGFVIGFLRHHFHYLDWLGSYYVKWLHISARDSYLSKKQ
uniref:Uncharacterized protein n=1 Tax=Strigamia maritima TaxID=126957 RepID=T1J0K6_STRMM